MIPFPEISLLIAACTVPVLDIFLPKNRSWVVYLVTQTGLLAAFLSVSLFADFDRHLLFSDAYVRDTLSDSSKVFLFIGVALSLVHAKRYLELQGLFSGEYQSLTLFAVLGMSILISAHNFLTLYLGLELLALSLYALSALNKDSLIATEAAIKYFIFGALASGVLLYGMSILYGVTGTLDLAQIARLLHQQSDNKILLLATIFVVAGVVFKFGAVPFHAWVPDVYQGTPTAVPQLIGGAPKIAALVMAIRILGEGLGSHQLMLHWQTILGVSIVASVAFGNLVALVQINFKRMLAYSAIASAGFILLGILPGTQKGYGVALFYAITYALTVIPAFGLLMILNRKDGFDPEMLDDFKGLSIRSPWYAGMMLLIMFSMAGIPPLVGFIAKFAILQEALTKGFLIVSIITVFFSVIGVYYYLRVIRLMYFDEVIDHTPINASYDVKVAISLNALLLLIVGMFPTSLISYCIKAVGLQI
ncbi:NADH-quinone oxidoreductase subunit N [Gammaproteobacteria bacterium]